ncbi:TPA: bleomycin resistance protein [Providencia alcalifaciens]
MISWNKLVPELIVSHLDKSLNFWVEILGFSVLYARKKERFCYLERDGVQFMLEEFQEEQWVTAPLETPFGRGINFQIEVDEIEPILASLKEAKISPFSEPQEVWYQANDIEHGQIQFLVQDPDGYLLRLVKIIGERDVRHN